MKRTGSGDRGRKLVSLFVASALVLGGTAGCSDDRDCIDRDRDGYCDGSGGRSGYYYGGGSSSSSGKIKSGTSSPTSGVSKGGIGGSGSSSS
ncbi:hypothetical protein [Paenibacillus sp. YYML68]|uniref:hypothetical protein n=1 Tax=Paenibacillus sp. YYML68 TaxID=2909250 RepID=UPI002490015C|nr:hypothetical protein [Paenibacillus sp. YYML68]